jgi:hypothetical protein
MHQWTTRYFELDAKASTLSYKLKNDPNAQPRATFELAPGCLVTDVEDTTAMNKKLFSFWVVWPHDKKSTTEDEEDEEASPLPITDPSKDPKDEADDKEDDKAKANKAKAKNLKNIVENEVLMNKRQRHAVEKQLERHHAHDAGVSMGCVQCSCSTVSCLPSAPLFTLPPLVLRGCALLLLSNRDSNERLPRLRLCFSCREATLPRTRTAFCFFVHGCRVLNVCYQTSRRQLECCARLCVGVVLELVRQGGGLCV